MEPEATTPSCQCGRPEETAQGFRLPWSVNSRSRGHDQFPLADQVVGPWKCWHTGWVGLVSEGRGASSQYSVCAFRQSDVLSKMPIYCEMVANLSDGLFITIIKQLVGHPSTVPSFRAWVGVLTSRLHTCLRPWQL